MKITRQVGIGREVLSLYFLRQGKHYFEGMLGVWFLQKIIIVRNFFIGFLNYIL